MHTHDSAGNQQGSIAAGLTRWGKERERERERERKMTNIINQSLCIHDRDYVLTFSSLSTIVSISFDFFSQVTAAGKKAKLDKKSFLGKLTEKSKVYLVPHACRCSTAFLQ